MSVCFEGVTWLRSQWARCKRPTVSRKGAYVHVCVAGVLLCNNMSNCRNIYIQKTKRTQIHTHILLDKEPVLECVYLCVISNYGQGPLAKKERVSQVFLYWQVKQGKREKRKKKKVYGRHSRQCWTQATRLKKRSKVKPLCRSLQKAASQRHKLWCDKKVWICHRKSQIKSNKFTHFVPESSHSAEGWLLVVAVGSHTHAAQECVDLFT